MRINFPTTGGPHLVSFRGRIQCPADYFRSKGWEVVIGPHVPADVHVFSKHWSKEADLNRAATSPCPVFDICDDHFGGPHGDYYRTMVRICHVITSSEGLKAIAGKGTVISEPWELPEGSVRTPTEKKALWYGHASNLPTLKPLKDALEGWEVMLVTNAKGCVPFSLENMREGLEWCHVVLLPQTKSWKSPNRMIEAFRAGRFPLLAHIPAYSGFAIPTGNEADRLNRVFDTDWTDVLQTAQDRVRGEFSPEEIGRQWFDCISAAAKRNTPTTSTSTALNPLLI
jgi:hypothetical protein